MPSLPRPPRKTIRETARRRRHRQQRRATASLASSGFAVEQLERRAMLATYSLWNLVNQSDYALVFVEGTEQAGRTLAPVEASVIRPGFNYNYSVFETYVVDVRSDPSDASTSIGTASVSVQGDVGSQWLVDSNNLLNFQWDIGYSQNLNDSPWYISGQLITVNLPTWGWNNDSPYDISFTAVNGTDASPAVGTVIAAGSQLSEIMGTGFEFDILTAGGSEILGHSVIAIGTDDNGYNYLYDTSNLAVFSYNAADSAADNYANNWQDLAIDLAPAVISNAGWTSGMGNTSIDAVPGQSFWAIDYGSEPGRWTIEDGVAYQSNEAINFPGGTNYGSRAYPVTLDANYQASYGPGSGFDGLWQMDIKIGSTGSSDNSFVETFYLAERFDPRVGVDFYSDGSPAGGSAPGDAAWSREIDIMETRWNGGGKVGPQINLPTGRGGGGPFTGWTTDSTYYDTVLGEWDEIGGAPTEQFATFGVLIRGQSLWIYAYKPDGTLWYSTEEVLNQSDYQQAAPFVPYIGTWGDSSVLGNATINDAFKTGYKNFVYLQADNPLIANANPFENPNAFGPSLVSATQSGLLAFGGVSEIAASLRLAEENIPQVPGLDVSPAQMLPARLSDILGLDDSGNGQTTWSDFDSRYPFPTVADVQSVANTIAATGLWQADILPSNAGSSTSAGNSLQSSTDAPRFAQLPDLQLGSMGGFTIQGWLATSDLSQGNQRIIDFGAAEGSGDNNIVLSLGAGGLVSLGIGAVTYTSTTPISANNWHHVSAVVNGTTAQLFLDGTLSDTFTGIGPVADVPRANNYWGRSNWAEDPAWQGQQDELRIWSRPLSAVEVAANFNLVLQGSHPGLLAYYKADDTSGSTLVDASGNTNDAVRMTLDADGNAIASTIVTSSSLTSLLSQNGVVITWSPSQIYRAVVSTGTLDEVLKLRRGPTATIPVTASGRLQLTLALNAAGDLLTGVSASWTATTNEDAIDIDAGLGYLDTRIVGGSYTLAATATAQLLSPGGSTPSPGGTTATSTTVSPLNITQASSDYFPASGTVSVEASFPFAGEVAGVPLPAGASAPTATLAYAAPTWTTASGYPQPLWTLENMGHTLALAQLDLPALVSTGLRNVGGSLSGLDRTSWMTVPFSSDVLDYDWGADLDGVADLLTERLLTISASSRVTGWLPTNNYGATFVVSRGDASDSVDLLGNLATDTTGIDAASGLLAAPIASVFAERLAGSGLSCREVPGRPGFLEFYATDASITGFSMSPLNPDTGDYPIGTRTANALSALGFFAEQTTALQLTNGSFEGPYAGTASTPYVINPSGGQWVFTGTAGLARNGSDWYAPAAPAGQQAAFLQADGTATQTIYGVAAGTYQLGFSAVQKSDAPAISFEVYVDDELAMTVTESDLLTAAWQQFTTSTFTLSEGTHTIAFQAIGTGDAAVAIDDVQLFNNLSSEMSSAATFSTLRGMLEILSQQGHVGQVAPPSALTGKELSLGQLSIDAGKSYTAATLPAAIQFVANAPGGSVTPLLFSVAGSGLSAVYTLVAAGRSIDVIRSGLQTAPLVLPGFTPQSGVNYALGFTDRSMSLEANVLSTSESFAGTIGIDDTSADGAWLFTSGNLSAATGASLALGMEFGESSGTALTSGRVAALTAFTGLAQAGSGSVARPETATANQGISVYTGAAYTTAFLPTSVRFFANATGTITPLLLQATEADDYTVAAVGDAIAVGETGLNEQSLFFPTLGDLSPGATYLFGFQNAASGVIAMQAAATESSWMSAGAASLVTAGSVATFVRDGVHSLDIIASTTSGSSVSDSNAAVFDSAVGTVMIDSATTFSGSGVPTAMQVQAELAIGVGSAFVTPLVFAVEGTAAEPTYRLVGAANSQELTTSGVARLPVSFASSLLAGLSPTGSYVMGFSTINVELLTGGGIATSAAFPGIVGRAATSSGGNWLVSAGLNDALSMGDVFSATATGTQRAVTAGRTYACTFLTAATQTSSPSRLVSLQYAGGLTIDVSYADLSTSSADVAIEAEAISALNVPGVSDLTLSGADDVPVSIAATRQFTLALDASVMTTGATLANQQQQAVALPITTGVLTEIIVTAGSQRYGIDGYVSDVITLQAGTQVYTTPPVVSITDAGGTGSGATALAQLDPNTGLLSGINLVDPGAGYTAPVFTIIGNNTAATASARWAGGVVTGAEVIDGSGFYAAAPLITITDSEGNGSGAVATATLVNGVVTGITIVSGGSGYVRPRITVAAPAVATGLSMSLVPVPLATIVDDTGVGATATVLTDDSGLITGVAVGNHQATANVVASNGVITGIDITFGGATYTSLQPPMVTISDASGTGSGALATVTVSADGVVTGITVTAGGSGYVNPVVSIGPPATLNSGYTNPTVVFSVPGMPDFVVPADATAIVTNGVFAAQVTNPGVLYQSAPIVTISDSAGSGGGAVATA
ncbi:MAG: LamG-like jellyroll fold domain-containing protein, partial [Pirellulales bacterium]